MIYNAKGTEEPTEDITTELVKEKAFRYAHYYFDRKTKLFVHVVSASLSAD